MSGKAKIFPKCPPTKNALAAPWTPFWPPTRGGGSLTNLFWMRAELARWKGVICLCKWGFSLHSAVCSCRKFFKITAIKKHQLQILRVTHAWRLVVMSSLRHADIPSMPTWGGQKITWRKGLLVMVAYFHFLCHFCLCDHAILLKFLFFAWCPVIWNFCKRFEFFAIAQF